MPCRGYERETDDSRHWDAQRREILALLAQLDEPNLTPVERGMVEAQWRARSPGFVRMLLVRERDAASALPARDRDELIALLEPLHVATGNAVQKLDAL